MCMRWGVEDGQEHVGEMHAGYTNGFVPPVGTVTTWTAELEFGDEDLCP